MVSEIAMPLNMSYLDTQECTSANQQIDCLRYLLGTGRIRLDISIKIPIGVSPTMYEIHTLLQMMREILINLPCHEPTTYENP